MRRLIPLVLLLGTMLLALLPAHDARAQMRPAPQPEEQLYSKPLMVAGFVAFPVGGVIATAGSFMWLFNASVSCDCAVGGVCDCGDSMSQLGLGLWVGGGLTMLGGIVMAIVGSRADDAPPSYGALPELEVGPGDASLRWTF